VRRIIFSRRGDCVNVVFRLLQAAIRLRQARFSEAQTYIDGECIRRMTPLVPVAKKRFANAGRLRDSVTNPTPGRIEYTAPFARNDYYANKRHQPPHGGNPQGTRLWFAVMKQRDGQTILRGAAKIVRGRPKL